ncbi:MAG: hypothetical protein BWK76_06545 [Desulfobulbaceae bacterium A2]|nr:MAG: hypothetical protein BWK76_06545 [Desulfobulbaceae bacterium A2]
MFVECRLCGRCDAILLVQHSERLSTMVENSGKKLVYLVQAAAEVADIFLRLLPREEFEVELYASGEEVFQRLFINASPDLLISTLSLPDFDAWRLCRLLRSPEFLHFNAIPVLVVETGAYCEEVFQIAREAGADAFIPLPASEDELLARIRLLLRHEPHVARGRFLIAADLDEELAPLTAMLHEQHMEVERVADLAGLLAVGPLWHWHGIVIDADLIPAREMPPPLAQQAGCCPPTMLVVSSRVTPELVLAWLKRGALAVVQRPCSEERWRRLLRAGRRECSAVWSRGSLERQLQELREHRERFAMIADKAADMIWTCDLDFHLSYVSPSVEPLTGFTQEQYLTLPPERMLLPGSLSALGRLRDQELKLEDQGNASSLRSPSIELELYRQDGAGITVEAHLRFLRDDQGLPSGIVGISRDVTERNQARRELQELHAAAQRSAAFNAALIAAMPLPVFVKSADGRHIGCNQAFTDFTGLTVAQIQGKLPTELWPIELSNVYRWNDIAHLAGVAPGNYEYKIPHSSGELRDVLFAKDVFYDETGKLAGIVGVFMDLSRQKRSEEIIRHRSLYLEALTDGVLELFGEAEQMSYQAFVDRIGSVSGAGRVFVFSNSRDAAGRLFMHLQAEWCAPGVRSLRGTLLMQGLAYDAFLSTMEQTLARGEVFCRRASELNELEREILLLGDIRSLLAQPILVAGEFFGFISFVDGLQEREWSEEDKFLLRMSSVILAQAIRRRRLELEQQSERRLFLAGPVAVCRWLPREGWPLTYATPNIETLTGYQAAELMSGQTDYAAIILAEDLPRVRDEVTHFSSSGARHFEHAPYRLRHRDGRIVWVLDTTDIVRDQDGAIREYIGYLVDITALKQTEEERGLLMLAIEQTEEGVFITDTSGRVRYANPALFRISGYDRAEVQGLHIKTLGCNWQDTARSLEMWTTVSSGNKWRGRFINRRKNGELYTEDCVISPVKEGDGGIVGYVAVKRDITRELELEDQLAQSRRVEALGRLAGGIAHDFNNLLQVILGSNELALMDLEENHPARSSQLEIRQAGEQAISLVERILGFSRPRALRAEYFETNALIAGFIPMIQRVIGEHITLHFAPSAAAGGIMADHGLLEQVLLNLCINARDAMPDGGEIRIRTGAKEVNADQVREMGALPAGRYVAIRVNDTGQGMDAATRERLFEPFFTTKSEEKGSGLGLANVYSIVKQHCGGIEVHSLPGQGTSVVVYFPEARDDGAVHNQEPAVLPGRGETILLAEDNDKVRALTESLLHKAGYRVLSAADGKEALDLFSRFRTEVDLLCLDLLMPRMGGERAWRDMRSQHAGVPVLFVSGSEDRFRQLDLPPGEPIFFLAKPYNGNVLLRAVQVALSAGTGGGGGFLPTVFSGKE